MKRLLLLHTGGTLGMRPSDLEGALCPPDDAAELLAGLPEARAIAEVEARTLYNLDSSNSGIREWQLLADVIEAEMDAYDGFVIVHGTDTMVYTASALSYMLSNLPKPVILTGAQRPISELRTDARNNLISALELATMDVPEVGIFFNHALYRGNRAKKVSIHEFDAFASPNFPTLADVGLKVALRTEAIRRPAGLFRVHRAFSDKVLAIRVTPGMDADLLMPLAEGRAEAIVLEAFGAGNVPIAEKSLLPFIEAATKSGKVVAIASQAMSGAVDLDLYECGARAAQAGAVSCGDMTVEAATVKLMFLLGQLGSAQRAAKNLGVPLAGEITA
ncbi:asparaginase [bacterium]|nr:asparaginase [bacterium]